MAGWWKLKGAREESAGAHKCFTLEDTRSGVRSTEYICLCLLKEFSLDRVYFVCWMIYTAMDYLLEV